MRLIIVLIALRFVRSKSRFCGQTQLRQVSICGVGHLLRLPDVYGRHGPQPLRNERVFPRWLWLVIALWLICMVMTFRNQLSLGNDLARNRKHRNQWLLEGNLDPTFPVPA